MSVGREPELNHGRDRLLVNPAAAQSVLAALRGDGRSPADLTKVVMSDPALTAAVLRAANSLHLGFARRIGGVRQAMVMLGDTLVASLAASRVADLLFDEDPPEYPSWLWLHSLATACAAEVLARRLDEPTDEAFTVGLLHDIGWLHAASNGGLVPETGRSHTKTAVDLLTRWNLPERFVATVGLHHARASALVSQEDRIVVAAHSLAAAAGAPSPELSLSLQEALTLVGVGDVNQKALLLEVEHEITSLTSDLILLT